MSYDATYDVDGNSWEADVKRWLRLRYPNDFQSIPATDSGDGGIEGFCICDQLVYQCYAAIHGLDTKALYEKQRDKLTKDINKFINNVTTLLKVLPPNFKAKRYWYVISDFRSRELVGHAHAKSEEVRSAQLPYATEDFLVLVKCREDFEAEQKIEQDRLLRKLNLELDDVEADEVKAWIDENNDGVRNLDRKIPAFTNLTDPADIRQMREYWIARKMCTDNALEKLRIKSPTAWEKIVAVKTTRERLLGREFMTANPSGVSVANISDKLATDMIERVPNLEKLGADTLAEGLVGGWLQDCKLNFPTKK